LQVAFQGVIVNGEPCFFAKDRAQMYEDPPIVLRRAVMGPGGNRPGHFVLLPLGEVRPHHVRQ